MSTSENEAFVRSFARGLSVIEALGRGPGGQTLAELAAAVTLPRTAVRRLLATLAELSFVRTDGKRYLLTPRVLRLGLSFLGTLPYWHEVQPTLEELSGRLRQSCALSVLDGEDVVYIQRQHAKRILPMSPTLGSRLPSHAVSMGRVLLAGLDDATVGEALRSAPLARYTARTTIDRDRLLNAIRAARDQGWCWVDGELDESICGLAVPVRDRGGATIAALNVSLPSGEFTRKQALERFLPELRIASSRLRASDR